MSWLFTLDGVVFVVIGLVVLAIPSPQPALVRPVDDIALQPFMETRRLLASQFIGNGLPSIRNAPMHARNPLVIGRSSGSISRFPLSIATSWPRINSAYVLVLCTWFRQRAVCSLLLTGDATDFHLNMMQSAAAFLHFMDGCDDEVKVTSHVKPFLDALCGGYGDAAHREAQPQKPRGSCNCYLSLRIRRGNSSDPIGT